MFAALSLKASLGTWRALYCETAPRHCARLKAFLAGAPCPDNLLPNGRLLKIPLRELEPKDLA